MTKTEDIILTVNQIEILRLMISFHWDTVRNGHFRAYRNGYCAADMLPELEQLCRLNVCRQCDICSSYIYYSLTAKGAELLGRVLGVIIDLREELL